MSVSEAQSLLHTDADTLYNNSGNNSSNRRLTRSMSKSHNKPSEQLNTKGSTSSTNIKQRPLGDSVVNRETAASVNRKYRKEKEESIIWQKPASIREPSVHLTKSTPGTIRKTIHTYIHTYMCSLMRT